VNFGPALNPSTLRRLDSADHHAQQARWHHPETVSASIATVLGLSPLLAIPCLEFRTQESWNQALSEYMRLLEEAGSDLALVEPGRYLQVRRLCHERIAMLPPAQLKEYRRLVDHRARGWLEDGKAERDVQALWRVIDEAFCSSAGAEALDHLGDILFERGRYAEAELVWQQIIGPRSEISGNALSSPACRFGSLLYPDSSLDPARMRAKRLLTLLFRNDHESFARGLTEFEKEKSRAEGKLAGRTGRYVDLLRGIARDQGQPQHAGMTSRTPRVLRGPLWEVPISVGHSSKVDDGSKSERFSRASLPLFTRNHLLISNGEDVMAFDLTTGQNERWYSATVESDRVLDRNGPTHRMIVGRIPDMTLANDRIHAILGSSRGGPSSRLVCLDARTRSHPVWQVGAADFGSHTRADQADLHYRFDGAPLVIEDKVYIGITFVQDETTVELACYSAQQGKPHWRRLVCASRSLGRRNPSRFARSSSLTAAGRLIVYNTPLGAVVALDAERGQVVWAVTESESESRTSGATTSKPGVPSTESPEHVEQGPCIHADGLIYVVPAGDRRLWCLEADTGRLVWRTRELEVGQLLGVVSQRLILTTSDDLQALDARTGRLLWRQPPEGGSRSSGRGFLSEEHVYWPSRSGLNVLDARTGTLAAAPQACEHIPPGHLVEAGDLLAVVTTNRLLLFGAGHGAPGSTISGRRTLAPPFFPREEQVVHAR
jgi:outer membrane protein assembly factor BamB